MTGDHRRGTRVAEHVRVDVACKSSGLFRAAVFPTNRDDPSANLDGAINHAWRNPDDYVGVRRRGLHRCRNSLDLIELWCQTVHLPIPGDEKPHSLSFERPYLSCRVSNSAGRVGKHSRGLDRSVAVECWGRLRIPRRAGLGSSDPAGAAGIHRMCLGQSPLAGTLVMHSALIAATAALGGLLFGYDTGVIAGA